MPMPSAARRRRKAGRLSCSPPSRSTRWSWDGRIRDQYTLLPQPLIGVLSTATETKQKPPKNETKENQQNKQHKQEKKKTKNNPPLNPMTPRLHYELSTI